MGCAAIAVCRATATTKHLPAPKNPPAILWSFSSETTTYKWET